MAALLVAAGIVGTVAYASNTASRTDAAALAAAATVSPTAQVNNRKAPRKSVGDDRQRQLAQIRGREWEFLRTEMGAAGDLFDVYWDPAAENEVQRAHGARFGLERRGY